MQLQLFDSTGHKELRQNLKTLLLYVCDRQYISGFHKMTDKFNFNNNELTEIYQLVPLAIKEEMKKKYLQLDLALSPP